MGLDLGTISASVGLNTTPLAAGVLKAKGMFTGLDKSLGTGGMKNAEGGLAGLGNQLKSIAGLGGGASGAISGVGASLGTLGTVGLVVGGVVALGAAFYGAAKAAEAEEKINAQTNAVIASTGGVAHVTAAHVDELGMKLASISGTSHDVIKSAENIMLTFRNVANQTGTNNDIFDQAIIATEDMSIALGKDLNDSAIKVGKALADPGKGLTALRRYGVIFTDEQVAQAKAMQKNNDLMGAQKIILGELNKEFGGSAAAAGNTLSGAINKAKDALDQFAEIAGKNFLPILTAGFKDFAAVIRGLDAIKVPQIISMLLDPVQTGKDTGNRLHDQMTNFVNDTGKADARMSIALGKTVPFTKAMSDALMASQKVTAPKIDPTAAVTGVNAITKAFNDLKGASTATWVASTEGVKTLTNQLANSGLGGITQKEIDAMLQAMANSKHGIRASGYAMMQQILDAEGWASPQIRDAAAGMMTSIQDQIEQAQNLGPVTGQQVAKIVSAVLAGGPPLDAAGQLLMQQLGAIIAGVPLPTQPVTTTPPTNTPTVLDNIKSFFAGSPISTAPVTVTSPDNMGAVWSNINSFFAGSPIHVATVIDPASTSNPVLRAWTTNAGAGAFVAGEIQEGLSSVPLTVSATVVPGAGGATNAANGVNALNAAFAELAKTPLPGWSTDVDNATAGFAHMEEAIMNLTNQNGAAVLSWRNMRNELDKAKTQVEEYDKAITAAEAAVAKTEGTLSALNDQLSRYSSMKIAGEGKAADRAFVYDENSKTLQLQIMAAEDKHNYALAAQLTLQKEVNDRKAEEEALQASITYDPQHRALEKLLDPLAQQEMSYKNISRAIVATQGQIRIQNLRLADQQRGVDNLKKLHDAASIAVDNYTKTVDAMAANFLKHYEDMKTAAEALNKTVASSPNKALTIYEKQMTEMARKHKSFYGDMIGSAFKLNQAVAGGGVTASAAGGYTPVAGGGASPIIQVNSYTTLDGKVLTKTVSRYQGSSSSSYARSGGHY